MADIKSKILPTYSRIALMDEDSLDGYKMIPATEFFDSEVHSALRRMGAEVAERMVDIPRKQVELHYAPINGSDDLLRRIEAAQLAIKDAISKELTSKQ